MPSPIVDSLPPVPRPRGVTFAGVVAILHGACVLIVAGLAVFFGLIYAYLAGYADGIAFAPAPPHVGAEATAPVPYAHTHAIGSAYIDFPTPEEVRQTAFSLLVGGASVALIGTFICIAATKMMQGRGWARWVCITLFSLTCVGSLVAIATVVPAILIPLDGAAIYFLLNEDARWFFADHS